MLSVFLRRTKRFRLQLKAFLSLNLTIQATRAQTLLLQAIYQSWSHSGNVSSLAVNEALMNEVFQTVGEEYRSLDKSMENLIRSD